MQTVGTNYESEGYWKDENVNEKPYREDELVLPYIKSETKSSHTRHVKNKNKFTIMSELENKGATKSQTKKGSRNQSRSLTSKKDCDICKMTFPKKALFREHVAEVHKKGHMYTCHICNQNFKQFKSLVDHSYTHTGERPHECDECNITFYIKTNLNRHKRLKHNHTKNQSASSML